MKAKAKKPRAVRTNVQLSHSVVPVYAGVRVAQALQELTMDLDLYNGVRLAQLLEAVYEQGKKDGARHVRDEFEKLMARIPHRNPGKPRKK